MVGIGQRSLQDCTRSYRVPTGARDGQGVVSRIHTGTSLPIVPILQYAKRMSREPSWVGP